MPVRVSSRLLEKLNDNDSSSSQHTSSSPNSASAASSSSKSKHERASQPPAGMPTPDALAAATGGVIPPPPQKQVQPQQAPQPQPHQDTHGSKREDDLLVQRQEEVQKAHSLAEDLLARESPRFAEQSSRDIPCAQRRSECAKCFRDNQSNLLACKQHVHDLRECVRQQADASNARDETREENR